MLKFRTVMSTTCVEYVTCANRTGLTGTSPACGLDAGSVAVSTSSSVLSPSKSQSVFQVNFGDYTYYVANVACNGFVYFICATHFSRFIRFTIMPFSLSIF